MNTVFFNLNQIDSHDLVLMPNGVIARREAWSKKSVLGIGVFSSILLSISWCFERIYLKVIAHDCTGKGWRSESDVRTMTNQMFVSV